MPDEASKFPHDSDGASRIEGEPYTETPELGKVAVIIAGVAIGAAIGAGAALLLAPASGEETRGTIRRRVRKLTRRERGVWASLSEALEEAARERAALSRLGTKAAEAAAASVTSSK